MKKSKTPIIHHIPDFLDYCEIEKGLSDNTQKNYERYLSRFVLWLKSINRSDLLPYQLTNEHIWDYRLFLSRKYRFKGRSLKKITQNYYLIALRAILSYFVAKDIQCIPPDKIQLPKGAKKGKTVKFLNLEQIQNLLEAPKSRTKKGLRDKAILETFFSTGLRIAELISLNQEQFTNINKKKDLELSIIGKGERPRTVYFSERALEWIKKYLETRKDKEKALFINYRSRKDANRRLTARSIQRIIKKYSILAGIPISTTPHTLRHCLHPLTRIATDNGIVSARNLYFKNSPNVLSLDLKTLKTKKSKVIKKSYHIVSLYSIWADGYNLICSPLHRLFTIGKTGIEEIKIKDLKVGQFIAGIKKITPGKQKLLNPKFWRLIGYVLGDGAVSTRRRSVILYDKDIKILKFYQKIVKKLFKLEAKIKKTKNKNSYELRIYNIELIEFLKTLNLDKKSNILRVPNLLFSATNKEISEFLAGLYDAEGNSGTIRIFSSSKELLKDVQMLLLQLNIDSHLNERVRTVSLPQKRKFTHKFYTLGILHRPDQLRFKKIISTIKKGKLVIQPRYIGDKIPVQKLLQEIKKETERKKIKWTWELQKNHNIKYLKRYLEKIVPVRSTINKIIKQLESKKYKSPLLENLKKIVNNKEIKWLRVKKKTRLPSPKYSTFDFAVTHQNLITDGILSHNSYATDLLTQGVDLRTIQEFLGHKNIVTTQIYTHVTSKRLRDVHRKYHSGKNLK